MKKCVKCDEEKEVEKFVKSQGVIRSYCKECRNKARRTGKPVGNKGIFRSRGRGGRYDCKFRKEIIQRDGNKCTRCESTSNLHAHHIVPWKESIELRFDPENLITLCGSCHASIEPRVEKNFIPWNKGKKGVFSKETLELWSKQRKGVESWNKGKLGFRKGEKRKPHTEESRKKMSEKLKGKPWSEARWLAQKNKKEVL